MMKKKYVIIYFFESCKNAKFAVMTTVIAQLSSSVVTNLLQPKSRYQVFSLFWSHSHKYQIALKFLSFFFISFSYLFSKEIFFHRVNTSFVFCKLRRLWFQNQIVDNSQSDSNEFGWQLYNNSKFKLFMIYFWSLFNWIWPIFHQWKRSKLPKKV